VFHHQGYCKLTNVELLKQKLAYSVPSLKGGLVQDP
jgi:hypothetical protein